MPILSLDAVSPRLPDGFCFVADSAYVIGNVTLGEDSGIWFGSVLRGDNEGIAIGRGSNVQEHCVLHTDPGFPLGVGIGCTIGHRVTLHGCSVEDHSLVGMSSTILNGARIGRHCLVGAGTLITEGKEIPDGCLVMGSPGRVVRSLRPDEIESLQSSAEHYVRNARRFATGLAPTGRR
jgi:carbonic anhydrase/acetyltransferase-like protein (isoleucine patch superfamily)